MLAASHIFVVVVCAMILTGCGRITEAKVFGTWRAEDDETVHEIGCGRDHTFTAWTDVKNELTTPIQNLPGAPERMGFRIKNGLVEIQRARRREEQIKIFECLGQGEALHFVALLFGDDVDKRGIAGVGATVSHEVLEELFSHSPILRIAGEVIEVIG